MLKQIKQCISNLPEHDFACFYQDYIRRQENSIIDNDVKLLATRYQTLEDSNNVIDSLNILIQELLS